MRRLINADAPLRGRADVELVVQPFDYRTANELKRLARRRPDVILVDLPRLYGGS